MRSTGGGESGAAVHFEIWAASVDGHHARRITAGGAPLVWSPNGRRLLFTRFARGRYSLYVVDAEGSRLRQLAVGVSAATWLSKDAVAVMRPARNGAYAVYRLDLADKARLRKLFVLPGTPNWSPDGRRLAYAGAGGLYLARADGRDRRRIGSADSIPSWSPDGSRLLYSRGDAVCTTVVSIATTQCFTPESGASTATWTPDGHAIIFASIDSRTLTLARPDGTAQQPLFNYSQLFGTDPAGRLEDPAARLKSKTA